MIRNFKMAEHFCHISRGIVLAGKHVHYTKDLRCGAKRFTTNSGVFHTDFFPLKALAWFKSETYLFRQNVSVENVPNGIPKPPNCKIFPGENAPGAL